MSQILFKKQDYSVTVLTDSLLKFAVHISLLTHFFSATFLQKNGVLLVVYTNGYLTNFLVFFHPAFTSNICTKMFCAVFWMSIYARLFPKLIFPELETFFSKYIPYARILAVLLQLLTMYLNFP